MDLNRLECLIKFDTHIVNYYMLMLADKHGDGDLLETEKYSSAMAQKSC